MPARRPRFGPLRQQLYDTAAAAETAVKTTSSEAQRSMLQLTAAGMRTLAAITELVEDVQEGKASVSVETPILSRFGFPAKVPITLTMSWDVNEEDAPDRPLPLQSEQTN